jgi:hypothetical protein
MVSDGYGGQSESSCSVLKDLAHGLNMSGNGLGDPRYRDDLGCFLQKLTCNEISSAKELIDPILAKSPQENSFGKK